MEVQPLTIEEFEAAKSRGRKTKNVELLQSFIESNDEVWKLTDAPKSLGITLSRLAKRRGMEEQVVVRTVNGEIYLVKVNPEVEN